MFDTNIECKVERRWRVVERLRGGELLVTAREAEAIESFEGPTGNR